MAAGVILPSLSGRPRLADAQARLHALLRQRWAAPFVWGQHDCCLWAADAVAAQLGADPAASLRGTYDDARSAARTVRSLGGMQALAAAALGQPLRAPLLACEGDVGLTASGTLVVCLGAQWAAPGQRGLVLLPLRDAVAAWRVGCA